MKTGIPQETTEKLLETNSDIGLEISTRELTVCPAYREMIRQNRSVRIANKSFGNAAKFIFLGKGNKKRNDFHTEADNSVREKLAAV